MPARASQSFVGNLRSDESNRQTGSRREEEVCLQGAEDQRDLGLERYGAAGARLSRPQDFQTCPHVKARMDDLLVSVMIRGQ